MGMFNLGFMPYKRQTSLTKLHQVLTGVLVVCSTLNRMYGDPSIQTIQVLCFVSIITTIGPVFPLKSHIPRVLNVYCRKYDHVMLVEMGHIFLLNSQRRTKSSASVLHSEALTVPPCVLRAGCQSSLYCSHLFMAITRRSRN